MAGETVNLHRVVMPGFVFLAHKQFEQVESNLGALETMLSIGFPRGFRDYFFLLTVVLF